MTVPSRPKIPRGVVAFAAFACAAYACGNVLPAQDQVSPNRFVPKDACLVLRVAAPATWRTQFASTQVARLFEERTLAPLVEQGKQAFADAMRQLRESGAADADLVERLVTDYTGEIVVAMQLDADGLFDALEADEPPPLGIVVALRPDGSYPLDALAENLAKVAESEAGQGEPLRDLQVGDHRLRVGGDERMQYTLPAMVDGHFVVLVGTRLEESARALLSADDRMEAPAAGGAAALQMQLRVKSLLHGVLETMKARAAASGGPPIDLMAVFDALGFAAFDTIDLSLGAADDHVAMTAKLAMDGNTGLFGSFLVDQGAPRLLRYVPAGCESFSVMAFDVNALWRTIGAVWATVEEVAPMTFEQVQQMAAEQLKVRLQEDLLAHVGTELLTVQDVAAQRAPLDEDDVSAAVAGTCLALRLRDGKAFGSSLETALRARGLHAARKTEEYQGTKVHRLRLGGIFEVEYAVTDDLLLIGLGDDESSRQSLRGILDARGSGAEPALPESVQDALKTLPGGWSGLAVTPVADMLLAIQQTVRGMAEMGEPPPDAEPVLRAFEMLGGVAADLKRLGLQHMVTTTYTTSRSATSRARW